MNMDAQMQMGSGGINSTDIAVSSAFGKSISANSLAKTNDGKEAGSFTHVLQLIAAVDGQTNETEMATAALFPSFMAAVFPDLRQSAETEQSLLESLKSMTEAMNNDELADQLMKDPLVQLLIGQMIELVQLPQMGDSALPMSRHHSDQLHQAQVLISSEEARVVLANFVSELGKQPDDPTLQIIAQRLQQALKPLITAESSSATAMQVTVNQNLGMSDKTLNRNQVSTGMQLSSSHATLVSSESLQRKLNVTQEGVAVQRMPFSSGQTLLHVLAEKSSGLMLQHESLIPASMIDTELNTQQSNQAIPASVTPVSEQAQAVPLAVQVKPTAQLQSNAQHLVQDMSQYVVKNIKLTNGTSQAMISLYPQHLGKVDVKLTMTNGMLAAQFVAETLQGKELLESQLPQLRAALQTQGLHVDRLVVNQSSQTQSSLFHEHQHQSNPQFMQQNQHRHRQPSYDVMEGGFIDELAVLAQMRGELNGNAFDVTA